MEINYTPPQSVVGFLTNMSFVDLIIGPVGSTKTTAGIMKIAYHAKLPVAWGSKTNLPTSYDFKLPKDVSDSAQTAFTNAFIAAPPRRYPSMVQSTYWGMGLRRAR